MASQEQVHPVFTSWVGAAPGGGPGLSRWLARLADRLLGLTALQRLYVDSARQPHAHFVDRALATLGVQSPLEDAASAIPATGPLVIVANHPHGALDGLLVASLALRRRLDVRILGTHLLQRIPEIDELLIPVDVFGGAQAGRRNARALRDALRWLQSGGGLCVFPSGEVAHGGWGPHALESAWHDSIARLAKRAAATTVRCEIDGDNGLAFRLIGRVHARLRTALLPRMLLARRNRTVALRVVSTEAPPTDDAGGVRAPAVHTISPVEREVAPLLERQALVRQGDLSVCWTRGEAVPALLEQLGRAREAAFRAAGEGTGRDVDLDAFDPTYVHLCLWDHRERRLAGAYRMGLADELARAGAPLYSQTLFDFDARLLAALGPSIELGRAFLAAPYQRQYAPLALLWSAIGRFVAARPHYRSLFGAVSIDTAYGPAARHAMVSYLQQHAYASNLAPLVAPRHPLTHEELAEGPLAWAGTFPTADVTALDDVVARLDPLRRGVPVLLRQYLRLHARAIAFSIDPAFSDVLDALIVVDLPNVPTPMLRRFMGSGAAQYLARHTGEESSRAEGARRHA